MSVKKTYRLKVGKMYFCGYAFCAAGMGFAENAVNACIFYGDEAVASVTKMLNGLFGEQCPIVMEEVK